MKRGFSRIRNMVGAGVIADMEGGQQRGLNSSQAPT